LIVSRIKGQKLDIKLPVQLSYVILGVVGIGSTLFHATLLYSCQLLDELPMVSLHEADWGGEEIT
jgi:hypothetical protein